MADEADEFRVREQERRASQESLPDPEWIELQRAQSLSRLTQRSDSPSATPAPDRLSTAASVAPPRSRFVEDFRRSAPTTVVGTDPLTAPSSSGSAPLPAPAPAAPSILNRLLDRAKRGWQAVKPQVDRAVRFAKENPWIAAGIVVGAVGGAILAGPAGLGGLVVGAGLGAAGGAFVQRAVRESKERSLAAQESSRRHARERRETPSMSPSPQGTTRARTSSASPDRARSRQFEGPARSDARRTTVRASGEVAAVAALRASGTDRIPSVAADASRDTATRPVVAAKNPGRRMTS